MSFGSDDDFGLMFFLPWWLVIPLLLVLLGIGIYEANLTPEEKTARCTEDVKMYNLESKWTEAHGCIVRVREGEWKALEKFEKDGVVYE